MRPSSRRSSARSVLVALAASALLSVRAAGQTATEYLARGMDHLNQRRYDEAVADFTEAIRLDPKEVRAYWGFANRSARVIK